MKENHIVYITDNEYAMPTCVSIISLKMTRRCYANYYIHVLTDGISRESEKKIQSISEEGFKIEILIVENDAYKELAKTCLTKHITVTYHALYKFDIANILQGVDKALYLDGDILINKDISELFDIDLSDMYVAAVNDMGDQHIGEGKTLYASRIGLEEQDYFNSGVLMLNLQMIRQDNICEQLVKYRMEQNNYFMDQDAINSVMGKKRINLPFCYNFIASVFNIMDMQEVNDKFLSNKYEDIESCLMDQAIIHMAEDILKPWKYNLPWITELFLSYYAASSYKEKIHLLSPLKLLNDQKKNCFEKHDNLQRKVEEMMRTAKAKIWKFPYNKVKKGSKVVLYGAGRVGYDLYKQSIESEFCEIVLWVDKNHINKSDNIVCPERIRDYDYDYVIIALADKRIVKEIGKYLLSLEVNESKIVTLL